MNLSPITKEEGNALMSLMIVQDSFFIIKIYFIYDYIKTAYGDI